MAPTKSTERISTLRSRPATKNRSSKGESKPRSKSASRQSTSRKNSHGRPPSTSRKSAPPVTTLLKEIVTPTKSGKGDVQDEKSSPEITGKVRKRPNKSPVSHPPPPSPAPAVVQKDSLCHSCFLKMNKLCKGVCDFFGFSLPWGGPLVAVMYLALLLVLPLSVFKVATHKEPFLWRLMAVLRYIYHLFMDHRHYFHTLPYAYYGGFMLLQVALGLLPLSRSVVGGSLQYGSSGKRLSYRCMGLVRLVLTAAALAVMFVVRKEDLLFMRQHWTVLVACMAFTSVSVGILVYLVSLLPAFTLKDRVPFVQKGFWPYGALVGTLLHPQVPALAQGRADLKLWSVETSLISWLVLDCIWLVNKTDHVLAVTLVALHVVYVVVLFLQERAFLFSCRLVEEGYGLVQSVLSLYTMPWLLSMPVCYLVHTDNTTALNLWSTVAIVAFFLGALGILYLSRQMKTQFQVDPYNPDSNRAKTISAAGGKYIFADGPYALVRHPQSLCEIAVLLAFTLLTGVYSLPWMLFALGCCLILVRMWREEVKSVQTYGAVAWNAYKASVPYLLVPYLL